MKIWRILTLSAVVLAVAAGALAGFTTWLSPAMRTGMFAVAAIAFSLVVYFNWRQRFARRMVGGDERNEALPTSA